MISIQRLLNRNRWDGEFGAAYFEIGYVVHAARKIIRIPFTKIHPQQGNQFRFQFEDERDEVLVIPSHRIRRVFRNGVLI